jgi:hypothetical protein
MIFWTLQDDGQVIEADAQRGSSVGQPAAIMVEGNILDAAAPPRLADAAATPRLIVWSGWFDSGDDAPMRTWSSEGWQGLLAWCDVQAAWAEARDARIWLRPHAAHVLSDVPRCTALLRELSDRPIDILLDPASMLTAHMLPRGLEHLQRAIETLADHPRVAGLLLANVSPAPDRRSLRLAALHQGSLDPAAIKAIVREHWPADKPVILLDHDVPRQVDFLRA